MKDAPQTTVYGTEWCGSSRRVRLFLDQHRIPYLWIDIDLDQKAALYVEGLNRGYRRVPTIVRSDGSILVEPSNDELARKLGLQS